MEIGTVSKVTSPCSHDTQKNSAWRDYDDDLLDQKTDKPTNLAVGI